MFVITSREKFFVFYYVASAGKQREEKNFGMRIQEGWIIFYVFVEV